MAVVVVHYQIEAADYSEANALFATKSNRFSWEMWSLLASACLLVVLPLSYKVPGDDWQYPFLVVPFACFLLYLAILYLFPRLNARRWFANSNLAGKPFVATVSASGLRVEAAGISWETAWSAFIQITESRRLFVFYDGFHIYILAKRYFAAEQVIDLQTLVQENWISRSVASSKRK